MAITHFTPQLISRGSGRSAVLSAAYRHCARMEHQAEGRTVDYSAKRGLRHEEFLLPPDAPQWARELIADRSVAGAAEAFWNAIEAFEKRSDAQLAKEFIIALPVELTIDRNIALVREFVATQVLARGQVADWVFHDEPGNPHIHLMTTLRPLGENGFGPKKVPVIGDEGVPTDVAKATSQSLARAWSVAFHDHPAKPDGIIYPSRLNGHTNLAVFDHAVVKLKVVRVTKLIGAPSLAAVLNELRVSIVEPDP
ncbi:MobA/MobL family protein [Bradyrhizobium sp. Ai1a-2]|uniref:MobA/MobL family protein n=1 Tax=Bradyrhizobium sp. Ai1a-2 TaxID=196490 RepID=UPI000409928C